jgi:hypothetical protein
VTRPVENVKRWVLRSVVALLLLDASLFGIVWQFASGDSDTGQKSVERLQEQDRAMVADVRRAQKIREQLPDVRKDCDQFLGSTLLVASTGYSTIETDLGKITSGAGLPAGSVSFKQKAAEKQGIIEVEVIAVVEGDYSALVKFINGLERSKNLYLIDAMSMNAGHERGARLNLVMRTYFRS